MRAIHLLAVLTAGAQELPQWQRQMIPTRAANIELYTRGSGPAVLMHPGGGGSAGSLEELGNRVSAAGFRVVLINPRGIGASKGPLDNATLHDLAADVWDCADKLGMSKVHLLGRAFGNRAVRTASSDRPDRVMSVTLLAAGGEIAPAPADSANLRMAFDATVDATQRLTALRDSLYAPGNQPDPSVLRRMNGETSKKQSEVVPYGETKV